MESEEVPMKEVVWWIHCDMAGTGKRWRLAVDLGGEVYFPVEDFCEAMSIEEYRAKFPQNTMIEARPPRIDPRVTSVVQESRHRAQDGFMVMVAVCSSCFTEGRMNREIDAPGSDAWAMLRRALETAGWVVLYGDERPVVSRPSHTKSTRQFCPECVEELRARFAEIKSP